jgi:hypothetical protein
VGSVDINVEFVLGDIRKGFEHIEHALVPVGHGDGDSIGFGGGGQVFFLAFLCEIEGEFQDAVDAYAGHRGLLNDHFAVGALPPMEEYSPWVFSRTTKKSMSLGLRPASGQDKPGVSRTGLRLTY